CASWSPICTRIIARRSSKTSAVGVPSVLCVNLRVLSGKNSPPRPQRSTKLLLLGRFGRRGSPLHRTAAVDPEFEQTVLSMDADHDGQRLQKVGASRGDVALVDDRARVNRGHDRWLAVVRADLVLEPRLPHHELPLDEDMMLVEPPGEFPEPHFARCG